jgi:hypothetical protein
LFLEPTMRPPQHTLAASEVHHLAHQLLRPLLGIWPTVRLCTADVVVSLLCYAASRITTLADTCSRLRDAPDSDTVIGHLHHCLGGPDILDRRIRACLHASLPRALRRGRWVVAMDTTLIPYHGQPLAEPAEIYRGQPKSGTTHFHAYATAYVVKAGLRFTLALLWVPKGTPAHEQVRQLRQRVVAAGVKPRLLLLDRGFNNAGVVRYLHSARQPFITPQAVHGKKPKSGELTGLRLIRATHPTGWTHYSWKPNGQRRVSVDLCVLRRRRRDRRGHRSFLYACWGVQSEPAQVYRMYRLRFGIETSYRQMNQGRIRTTTRDPVVRLLFGAVALLLRNLWAWIHWTMLARARRGRRQLMLPRLALRVMLLWLLHLAEHQFGFRDRTSADHPPTERLATPRMPHP